MELSEMYNKDKLIDTRDTINEHLNKLYSEELSIDNYSERRNLIDALEFCLELVKQNIEVLAMADLMSITLN